MSDQELFLSAVTDRHGHVLGIRDPLEGFKPIVVPRRPPRSEDDVLATALYMERHGDPDGGMILIEDFLEGRLPH